VPAKCLFAIAASFFILFARNNDTMAVDPDYEIVATATRSASLLSTTPGINFVLNRQEIEATRPAAASDALGYVPGLDIEAGFNCSLMRRYELYFKGENLLGEKIDLYEDALFTVQGVRRYEGGLRISVF
jgi:outer membrane cobalamin receptor